MNAIEALQLAKQAPGRRVQPNAACSWTDQLAVFYYNTQRGEFRRIYSGFETTARVIPTRFLFAKWSIVEPEPKP